MRTDGQNSHQPLERKFLGGRRRGLFPQNLKPLLWGRGRCRKSCLLILDCRKSEQNNIKTNNKQNVPRDPQDLYFICCFWEMFSTHYISAEWINKVSVEEETVTEVRKQRTPHGFCFVTLLGIVLTWDTTNIHQEKNNRNRSQSGITQDKWISEDKKPLDVMIIKHLL